VILHSLRDRTLGVIPIRLALGVSLLVAARLAGAASTPALLAFVSGVIGITFLLFNDPRARFVQPRAEPVQAPTLPSTVGLAVLALITLIPQPTLTALLAGVCAGLGVAAGLSLPRIDPALYVDPRSQRIYRR
jgi:hypothetical protein